jgi:hypothetical protein
MPAAQARDRGLKLLGVDVSDHVGRRFEESQGLRQRPCDGSPREEVNVSNRTLDGVDLSSRFVTIPVFVYSRTAGSPLQ